MFLFPATRTEVGNCDCWKVIKYALYKYLSNIGHHISGKNVAARNKRRFYRKPGINPGESWKSGGSKHKFISTKI